jgi:T-complex protein 1 subunit beta
MTNCKVIVANTPMDYDKIKIYGTKVKTDSMDKIADIEQAEKDKMKDKVDKILKYQNNVFINRQLIYNYPE